MYEELLKLPFPAGARATKELKQALLSKDLIRAVNTHKLVETSASGSRRTCYFPSERIEDYTKKYKWLFVGDSGAVCIYCKLFCDSKNRPQVAGVLTGKPWTAYSRKKALDEHAMEEKCAYHAAAESAAKRYDAVREGRMSDIKMQAAQKVQEYKEVRAMVESLTLTLSVCAKQNLPLRGHRNETITEQSLPLTFIDTNGDKIIKPDTNRGNFLALVRLGYSAGDQNLTSLGSRPTTFTSHLNQDEILNIMAEQLRTNLVNEISHSPFSIIADESSDVCNKEQLCLTVRYVRCADDGSIPTIQEIFLHFVEMKSTKGVY